MTASKPIVATAALLARPVADHPLPTADIIDCDVLRAKRLIADHLTTLDRAASITDMPTTLGLIRHLRVRVSFYASLLRQDKIHAGTVLGMLGHNGAGPAIADVTHSAAFHGFTWRSQVSA